MCPAGRSQGRNTFHNKPDGEPRQQPESPKNPRKLSEFCEQKYFWTGTSGACPKRPHFTSHPSQSIHSPPVLQPTASTVHCPSTMQHLQYKGHSPLAQNLESANAQLQSANCTSRSAIIHQRRFTGTPVPAYHCTSSSPPPTSAAPVHPCAVSAPSIHQSKASSPRALSTGTTASAFQLLSSPQLHLCFPNPSVHRPTAPVHHCPMQAVFCQ